MVAMAPWLMRIEKDDLFGCSIISYYVVRII